MSFESSDNSKPEFSIWKMSITNNAHFVWKPQSERKQQHQKELRNCFELTKKNETHFLSQKSWKRSLRDSEIVEEENQKMGKIDELFLNKFEKIFAIDKKKDNWEFLQICLFFFSLSLATKCFSQNSQNWFLSEDLINWQGDLKVNSLFSSSWERSNFIIKPKKRSKFLILNLEF